LEGVTTRIADLLTSHECDAILNEHGLRLDGIQRALSATGMETSIVELSSMPVDDDAWAVALLQSSASTQSGIALVKHSGEADAVIYNSRVGARNVPWASLVTMLGEHVLVRQRNAVIASAVGVVNPSSEARWRVMWLSIVGALGLLAIIVRRRVRHEEER